MIVAARKRKKNSPDIVAWLLYGLLAAALIGIGVTATFVMSALKDMPALGNLEPTASEVSILYDMHGEVWTELHSTEHRIPTKLSELPEHFIKAILAAEDHRFYDHQGVDLRAILRAFTRNFVSKGSLEGGSTITQQLAKMAFLTSSRTYKRKIQDAVVAFMLERQYTKPEILEMYLNMATFGRGAYGPASAARAFFGKPVGDLTVDESAMIAGMLKGPYLYDPGSNPDGALKRRNTVLEQMCGYGYITRAECDEYKAVPLNAIKGKPASVSSGGYFLDYVLKQLLSRYPSDLVYGGGLRVYTTFDPQAQLSAEQAMAEVLDSVFPYKSEDSIQASSIIMDAKTGYILAMIGGRQHESMLAWNRATDAKRQPGSSFKPLAVYIPAIEQGMSPSMIVDDSPVTWTDPVTGEQFSPKNYSRTFKGPVSMRTGVLESLNVVACKVHDLVGISNSVDYVERLGITSLVKTPTADGRYDYTRSLALGGLTYGASLLDMAVAYGTIANRGIKSSPLAILKVVDKTGNVLEEHRPQRTLVISEETAYVMTDMLKDVVTVSGGTGRAANIGIPCAGKTGTTSDWKDAWFCGYTPNTVGVVWMGFDKEKTMEAWKVTGGSYPAQIWGRMMKGALKGHPVENFERPQGVVTRTVCTKSGLLAGHHCPASTRKEEIFIEGWVPTAVCSHDQDTLPNPSR